MKTLTVVTNIPSPYRLHLFEVLNRQLMEVGWKLRVNFMAEGHKGRPASWRHPSMSFEHRYWRDVGYRTYHFNPGLILHLLFHRSEVLMCGSQFDTMTGIGVSLFGRAKKKIAWTEGNTKTTGELDGFKGFLKRITLRRYDAYAVPGVEGRRYIRAVLGDKIGDDRFLSLPNLVDEKKFKPRNAWSADAINKVRGAYLAGEKDKLCIIPARIEWYKGLLEMFSLLDSELLRTWHIVIIGGGTLKSALMGQLAEQGLASHVTQVDQVDYAEMPKYYAAADLFVLPSLMDRNPLSVVEALHSGLPVAVSERCGNVDEAVDEGKNGWVLHVANREMFRKELACAFLAESMELTQMGHWSLTHNARYWDTKLAISIFIQQVGL